MSRKASIDAADQLFTSVQPPAFFSPPLSDDRFPKYGCFFGKVLRGDGGVISDPKNYIADFVGFKAVYFGRKFWREKKRNVISKKGRGGGVKAVWIFSKKTSIFGETVVPNEEEGGRDEDENMNSEHSLP